MSEDEKQSRNNTERDAYYFYAFLTDTAGEIAFSVSHDEFRDTIKSLNIKPAYSQKLLENVKNSVTEEVQQDINFFWNEYNIANKYNEITKLIDERKDKPEKQEWRPVAGHCDNMLNIYRIRELQERKKKLEELVNRQTEAQLKKRQILETKRVEIDKQINCAKDAENNLAQVLNLIENLERRY